MPNNIGESETRMSVHTETESVILDTWERAKKKKKSNHLLSAKEI